MHKQTGKLSEGAKRPTLLKLSTKTDELGSYNMREEVQLRGGVLLAPPHWQAEVAAVLAREAPQYVDEMLLEFELLAPTIVASPSVMRLACDLSRSLDHHLFDTLYHAVALEAGATLVTTGDRYFDKAAGHGGLIRLADFPVTAA